jgi:hypothetical protein
MSTPEIMVTTAWHAQGEGRNAYARLLTPELEVLIRNQNIETRDINSMKWPLFGLSRHAVCKLLMLRTDLLLMLALTGSGEKIPEGSYEYTFSNEYRIWFRCTDDPADEGQVFTRMHIAKVTPLAVTGNGYVKKVPRVDENGDPVLDDLGNQIEDDVHEGEALYIVEFRCDRWWWSSFRKFTFSPWVATGTGSCGLEYPDQTPFRDSWVESHNEGDVSGAGTAGIMVQKLLKGKAAFGCGLGDGNVFSHAFFREYRQDTFSIGPNHALRAASGNYDRHRPIVEVIDEICRECHLVISYRQYGSIASGYEGSYRFATFDINSPLRGDELRNFLTRHGDNVIAGAIDTEDVVNEEFSNPTSTYPSRWPRMINLAPIYKSIASNDSFLIAHRASIPDGRPPRVFTGISAYGESNFSTGSFNTQTQQLLPSPFSEFQPYDIVSLSFDDTNGLYFPWRPRFIALKKFPSAYIDLTSTSTVREWQERNRYQGQSLIYSGVGSTSWYHLDETGKIKPLSPIDLAQNFEEERSQYEERKRSNTCDIWLNKWWMPASDEVWLGAAWIELRLQTDEDGFGFPTTRIWSDYEDPLFCSVADDKPLDIRATGLAKAWRDSDGKTRVHVAWPFGIPCLIKIIGLYTDTGTGGQFNPGVKAWAYKAKVVMKGQGGSGSSFPKRYPSHPSTGLEYSGQLVDFFGSGSSTEDYLVAYNLAELANTTSFSAPGYKMPIAQQGFDVLPIGKDRDGNQHEVIVQAMVYWSDERDPPDPAVSPAQRSRLPFAYFCLTNAIDGECPTPLTLDQSLDGGTY